ncbi:hypothetical protein TanjilG_03452 [Lupinus angustifolius]|uniref:ATP-dependent helicase BRM n=1 Tax=Lupinus angustifolius TaxID=3871 RepID=A0A1J7FPA1_LUPAN|nr:hypothetical protein TanjilG_03452 [Lupinus angustifolius]
MYVHMQSFQQQLLRKPEGNESFLAYQAGVQGAYGSNSFPSPSGIHLPQQPRKFIDSAQHGSNQDAQLRGQGVEQQMRNPAHQAYLQYALQAQQKSAMGIQSQQQPMMGMLNPSSLKDQEMRLGNLKMQDLMSMQAMNQAQGSSSSRNSSEHVGRGEKQIEQGQHIAHDQKSDGKPSNQGPAIGYSMPENMIKPMQAPETQQGIQNVMNTQIAMSAQLQAVQAWARERNIDLSHPANASLMAQLIPLMQSRMVPQPKANESNVGAQSSSAPVSKQQVNSPAVASENSAHANSSSDVSGQSGSSKARQTVPPSHFGSTTNAGMSSNSSDMVVQQFSVHGRESQASLKQPAVFGNGIPSMHAQQSSSNVNLNADNLFNAKTSSGPDLQQMQHSRQLNQSAPQARGPPNEGGSGNFARSQGSPAQMAQQRNGFTKQQLHVLKAQILAFRRLKKGEGTLPQELLRAIAPPPLETQMQPPNHPSGGQIQDKSTGSIVAEQPSYTESNTKDSQSIPTVNGQSSLKQQSFGRDEKSIMPSVHMQAVVPPASKESAPMLSAGKEQQKSIASSAKSDQDSEHGNNRTPVRNELEIDRGKAIAPPPSGLSEEEVRAAATCAGEEMMIRNHFMEINTPRHSSSVNKYYSLAHAVNETVIRQPSMLRAGTLRDYQLVGLQWMLSLYNNKLNGILADEMGLGKTVQVMALIAYLMEFKGNYGPHLIIVPNAVLVNWKSELYNWLPSVSCIFYVGMKDQRAKLFSQEVSAMKFNVLVTTYEFIMYDRSKLSKIDWKYIIIDEAQRMKDRDSVLARDLDKYRCQRRLLLTGTPLQNDLKELWSLLNLLLPEVFDNKKAFNDWFSKPFQKECPTQNAEDDWLETEKKVIIIHRLHQILEPFMLRRRVEDVEGSLPPKVSIVLKCKMSAVQSAIYDWIKSTGTLRLDPEDEMCRVQKNPVYQMKQYKTLNNRCMELRKTCNHPLLNYPFFSDLSKEFIVKSCGKLWILDRILVKLQRTGHRVLLFSTMTKLLDILEEYLQWRRLVFRRIDGTTSLEDRESAIVDFNSPDSDCFIFLLSIRAAGRGLNLQSADTVVIYDPDPNPKNEEQAVARAHRIGQKREVKVIYMEAVVDKISSHQKEDELRSGGSVDMEDELAGKDRYIGSIESLIRNNIQQYKIDMADEVINAGRFDQRTTHEERRLTLETLLHDEERYQENVHDVPSLQEVNRMIARSEEEVELFDQMDEELDWIEEMTRFDQVPKWLRANTREVNAAIAASSKRPSKNILSGSTVGVESKEAGSERRRGRPKAKKHPSYKEVEDDNGEFSEASSEERNGYAHEEGEVGEFEDDGYSRADGAQPIYKDQLGDDLLCDAGYEFPRSSESAKNNQMVEEAGTSGSSSDSQRLAQTVSPSVSSQKFGSLSALDARPSSASKRMSGELEEGEIAVSGDSQMDHQQSGSWIHDRDEGEDEQVLQKPKIKRKRSLRSRPRYTTERSEEKSTNEMASHLAVQAHHKYQAQLRTGLESKSFFDSNPSKHDQNPSSVKNKRTLPLRRVANTSKLHGSPKSSRLNTVSAHSEDGGEHSRERLDGKPINSSGSSAHGTKTAEIIQRKCKNVIGKLQRRIDKEGHQIVPLLTDLWKKVENSGYSGGSGNSLLDLRKIDQRIDRLEYSGATELVFDVQFMLKSAMHFYGFSHEIRSEARKVHDLFFDILKIAFPDTDFQDARIALSFSSQVPAGTVTSPRPVAGGQSKRHRMINEAETDPPYPPHKSMPRGSASSSENTRIKVHAAQKESRPGNSTREQHQQADSPKLTHPGELVICKKRRNDRDKSIVKPRTGPVSPPLIGPSIRSPGSSSAPKDARIAQQNLHSQGWVGHLSQQASGSGGGSVGWANPVKRLRTDTGKRRPSHK